MPRSPQPTVPASRNPAGPLPRPLSASVAAVGLGVAARAVAVESNAAALAAPAPWAPSRARQWVRSRVFTRIRVGALLAAAVSAAASVVIATPEVNRMAAMDVYGGIVVDVKPAASGGPALVAIQLPKAAGDLQCRRPGFRPQQLIYGAAPLDHAVALGRALQARWKPHDDAKASVVHTFDAFIAAERGGPKQRKLLGLESAARGMCAQGKGGTLPPIELAMAGRCARVKGVGEDVGMVGASRKVAILVRCAAALPGN